MTNRRPDVFGIVREKRKAREDLRHQRLGTESECESDPRSERVSRHQSPHIGRFTQLHSGIWLNSSKIMLLPGEALFNNAVSRNVIIGLW